MKRIIFVGECRSLTAKRKRWTWKDGRLAAKPLFEALASIGVNPADQQFVNLWTDAATPTIKRSTIVVLRTRHERGTEIVVVALGKRVSAELTRRGVEHVALVHPAARGRIRKRERYIAHVAERVRPHLGRTRRACG